MAEIPKIVFERLRQNKGGAHPDADLLTAFAERVLPEREREQVLGHLAQCAECREVVALAAPEAPVAEVAPEKPRRFFGLVPKQAFVLAGALVACVVVVAVLSVPNLMRSPQQSFPVASESAPLPPPAAPATSTDTKLPAEQAQARDEDRAQVKSSEVGRLDRAPERKKAIVQRGMAVTDALADKATAAVPPAITQKRDAAPKEEGVAGGALEAKGSRANETVEVGTAAPAVPAPADKPTRAAESRREAEKDGLAVETETSGVAAKLGKQKAQPAAPAAAMAESQMVVGRGTAGLFYAVPPEWRISSAGILERSSDSGRTWQQVIVAQGLKFRALASVGPAVWAGGSGGAIHHSSDGSEFTRQALPLPEGETAGEIIRIEFADLQHGEARDSRGHRWTTSDSGTTWTLAR